MKTQITTNLILAATLSAFAFTPLPAATQTAATAYPVSTITGPYNRKITHGDDRFTVKDAMGWPDRRITPNVWIYRGYQADNLPQAHPHGCNAMLVTFTDHRVSDIKFVNPEAMRLIVENSARKIPTRYTAVDLAAAE